MENGAVVLALGKSRLKDRALPSSRSVARSSNTRDVRASCLEGEGVMLSEARSPLKSNTNKMISKYDKLKRLKENLGNAGRRAFRFLIMKWYIFLQGLPVRTVLSVVTSCRM